VFYFEPSAIKAQQALLVEPEVLRRSRRVNKMAKQARSLEGTGGSIQKIAIFFYNY